MIKWSFNEAVLNIMSNFIPNETIIFDGKDPPWLNRNIKNIMNYKNTILIKLILHKDNHFKLGIINFVRTQNFLEN